MPIQWFPGHMARARRVLAENLSLVDIVIELVDARIPFSSRNPEIDRIIGQKPRVIVCNKSDLADPSLKEYWKSFYQQQKIRVLFVNSKQGEGIAAVTKEISRVMQEKIQRALDKGRREPVIRAMVVGIPNVGKSSFINRIAGKAVAVTGDKPGVTRNKQWLKLNSDIFLLDTPGLLWPKIENQRSAYKLACTGAIKDDVLDETDIASFLLQFILQYYPDALSQRYRIDPASFTEQPAHDLLEECGRKRGCLLQGGEVDTTRAALILLDDFRAGKLGRITLDREGDLDDGGEISGDAPL